MKRIFLLTLFFCYGLILVQGSDPCPPGQICGGAGGDGFGTKASPIDMYIYILGIVAILFIAYFAKKYRAQKSIN